MKEKVAVIIHSFHQRTKSHEFFVEILEREYEVVCLFDESWNGKKRIPLRKIKKFSKIFFFHTLHYKEEILKLKNHDVFLVPMMDGVYNTPDRFWEELLFCKVISFSSTLHDRLRKLGLKSCLVRFYPKPNWENRNRTDSRLPNLYFWQRVNEINWSLIKKLVNPNQVNRVYLNPTVDPGQKFEEPSQEDIEKYKIEYVPWFETKAEHEVFLEKIDLFVAPRVREGIGFSFLNAMSKGCVIIGNNQPTLNEYITNENGFLFNINELHPLDLTTYQSMREKLLKCVILGKSEWEKDKELLMEFLRKNTEKQKPWYVGIFKK